MKLTFENLLVRFCAGDNISKWMAVIQAPIVFVVLGYLSEVSNGWELLVLGIVYELGIAAVQAMLQEDIGIDFGLFYDWFVINLVIASALSVLLLVMWFGYRWWLR